MRRMRVLITGGTGFIGRALARALLARGDQVIVLSRTPARAAHALPGGALASADFPATVPDAVVNLAGESLAAHRWTAARKQAFIDSRAGTTRRLVEWLRAAPRRPAVLVSGSAVGYYGARGDAELTEADAAGDEYQSGLCRSWETEARHAESLGVRVCLIRTGIVLGPDGGALAAMKLPFSLGLGSWLGDGRQWMSWIHKADMVALILWLLDGPGRSGAYNATAPAPVTNRAFAKALGASLRRPVLMPLPAPVVRLLVGEMAQLLLTGQKVLPARALAEGFSFRFPELDAALAEVWNGGR
jgi:uncharacterized protein (TIGR01777 family)